MQGREPCAILDGPFHILRDAHRLAEVLPPMHNTVPHRMDGVQGRKAPVVRVRYQLVEDDVERLFMIRDGLLSAQRRFSPAFQHHLRIRHAHPVYEAPRDFLRLLAALVQAVFHRGRAAIQHENNHHGHSMLRDTLSLTRDDSRGIPRPDQRTETGRTAWRALHGAADQAMADSSWSQAASPGGTGHSSCTCCSRSRA